MRAIERETAEHTGGWTERRREGPYWSDGSKEQEGTTDQ